jgi:hypothetical protein
MQPNGKRLKEKELSTKLLWNEELASTLPGRPKCEEKAMGQNRFSGFSTASPTRP